MTDRSSPLGQELNAKLRIRETEYRAGKCHRSNGSPVGIISPGISDLGQFDDPRDWPMASLRRVKPEWAWLSSISPATRRCKDFQECWLSIPVLPRDQDDVAKQGFEL